MSDEFWMKNSYKDKKCYHEQMRAASIILAKKIKTNPLIRMKYTKQQQEAILSGKDKIPGLTWHHKEDWLTMQLVNEKVHSRYRHTGGRSYVWNKNIL